MSGYEQVAGGRSVTEVDRNHHVSYLAFESRLRIRAGMLFSALQKASGSRRNSSGELGSLASLTSTPFVLADLDEASQRLSSFGYSRQDVIRWMFVLMFVSTQTSGWSICKGRFIIQVYCKSSQASHTNSHSPKASSSF